MPRRQVAESVFTAIADPTRRAILMQLRDGAKTASDLFEHIDLSQPAFSQHLAVLRRAHLVRAEREGRFQIYSVNPAALEEVAAWIAHFDRFWTAKLDKLGRYLDRPQRPRRPS